MRIFITRHQLINLSKSQHKQNNYPYNPFFLNLLYCFAFGELNGPTSYIPLFPAKCRKEQRADRTRTPVLRLGTLIRTYVVAHVTSLNFALSPSSRRAEQQINPGEGFVTSYTCRGEGLQNIFITALIVVRGVIIGN